MLCDLNRGKTIQKKMVKGGEKQQGENENVKLGRTDSEGRIKLIISDIYTRPTYLC